MKRNIRRSKQLQFTDPDFAEALCGGSGSGESGSLSARGQAQHERKTQQFCRQVQRALNLAIEDLSGDGAGMFVEEVTPAPDCGHLLAHVIVPEGRSIAGALTALRANAARLRSDVAMAIARKRAPELFFVPVQGTGGQHPEGGLHD